MLHDAGFMSSHEAASMYWNIVEGSIESIADDLENRGNIDGTVATEDYLISLEEYVDSIVKRLRRLAKNMKTTDGHVQLPLGRAQGIVPSDLFPGVDTLRHG